MKPVFIHRLAKQEYDRAIRYWNRQRAGLGAEFQTEIEQAIGALQRDPQLGAPGDSDEFRFWIERRFNYVIHYQETENEIWIIAIAHSHRRPNYWRRRRIG